MQDKEASSIYLKSASFLLFFIKREGFQSNGSDIHTVSNRQIVYTMRNNIELPVRKELAVENVRSFLHSVWVLNNPLQHHSPCPPNIPATLISLFTQIFYALHKYPEFLFYLLNPKLHSILISKGEFNII